MKTTVLLVLLSLNAHAANDPQAISKSAFQCFDLRKASQKLPVFAKNIANKDTSKYQRVEMVCHEMYCEQVARNDFKLIEMPNSPDANGKGLVQLPRIDVASEYAALTSAASEVRLLAQSGTCGANAIASATMAMVKYASGDSVQSDVFNYATDGHITSWSRTTSDGKSVNYAFNADGTVISTQQ